jgi:Domain of unknown function (DUF4192)
MTSMRGRIPPRPGRTEVRLSEPGDIAAALPHLLGFRPRESVVLIGLGGSTGRRVGLTARADLPDPAYAADLAAALACRLAADSPSAAVIAVVSEAGDTTGGPGGPDLPHRDLVHVLVQTLTAAGVPVRESLLVRRGRWWSFECPHACCTPGAGTPLPGGVSELEVASVAAGQVVADDRADLAARIASVADPGGSMAAEVLRVGRELVGQAVKEGRDGLAGASWSAVTGALERLGPGRLARMTDDEIARVAWGLRDHAVRDRALALVLGEHAAAAEQLWTECTRRAPSPLDAAPATLLAVSAWLRGDGTTAGLALRRALDSDPAYSLAATLDGALAACVRPAELRAVVQEALAQ